MAATTTTDMLRRTGTSAQVTATTVHMRINDAEQSWFKHAMAISAERGAVTELKLQRLQRSFGKPGGPRGLSGFFIGDIGRHKPTTISGAV